MNIKDRYAAKNGIMRVGAKCKEHLLAHPEVEELLDEALRLLLLPEDGSFIRKAIDLGRVIGKSGCVSTPPVTMDEPTQFAKRQNRDWPSRVITNVDGEDTPLVTVLAFQRSNGDYQLITAWVGDLAPREPWDKSITPEEQEESNSFWMSHALVYDPKVMAEPFTTSWSAVLQNAKKTF